MSTVKAVTKYNSAHGVESFLIMLYLSWMITANPGDLGLSSQNSFSTFDAENMSMDICIIEKSINYYLMKKGHASPSNEE